MSVRNVRSKLIDRLRYELVGPENEIEVIQNKPLQKYLAGILWPMKSSIVSEEDEIDNTHGREVSKETFETTVPLAKAMNPSAIGVSFLVDKNNPIISVDVSLGMYEDIGEDNWSRIPFEINGFAIDLTENLGEKRTKRITKKNKTDSENTNELIQLEWIVRPFKNSYAISLFLVNRYIQEVDEHNIDHLCVFQPKIIIKSQDALSFMVRNAFSNNEKEFQDEDTKTNTLLYRNEGVYAVGHSVSVFWKEVNHKTKRAGYLETEIIPAYEIPMVIPPDWDEGGTLDMKKLGEMQTSEEVENALNPLLEKYQEWIDERNEEVKEEIGEEYRDTAKLHIKNCQISLDRMKKGLKQLKKY